MKSTRPMASASSAEAARASSIVASARAMAAGRRRDARLRPVARRISFSLASMVSPRSSPWPPTGLAAPIAVSGAMAEACPARGITVPALPATRPRGRGQGEPAVQVFGHRRSEGAAQTEKDPLRPGLRPGSPAGGRGEGQEAQQEDEEPAGRAQYHALIIAGRPAAPATCPQGRVTYNQPPAAGPDAYYRAL